MKRFSTIIALSMMFILVVGNIVQAKNGWEIQIEPMLMDVDGYDEHVGDIYRSREEYSEDTAGNVTLDLSTTYEPLNLNMKDEFTLRGELIYRKGQWNLGASSWWFSADGSVIGTVTTPEEETTATGYVYYINGVRMWDNTIIPVYNELEDSLFSPVDYWAEDRLAVWTADLFLSRILAEKKDSYVSFCLGAKLGSLKTEENVGQKQRAFVYDYDYGCNFDNHITLEGMAEADCGFMAGPVLGFKGKAERGKFGIEGFLSQSVVFGKVEHTGLWKDIDNILWIDSTTGAVVWHDVLTGESSFSKDEEVAFPVTELQLKIVYNITESFFIGVGGFYSIWWDAPVAPKWSMPGDWTWDEGTGWRLQERTLKFGGLKAVLGIYL